MSSLIQEPPEGIELTGVCYELLRWEAGPSLGALVDASMSVILRFGNSVNIRFHWAVGNGSERLTIARWHEGDYLPQTRMEDVSDRWQVIMGARVVGLTRDGEIIYIPDSLVITGSEATARSYRPAAASSAAWGE